jgi:peptidoglycan/LPS O-acetylase OafA/YrhL
MTYRPEIDGLRAVAVLAVLLYHAEVAVCSGGYVGVDVFFVISGYLITRMVYEAARQGRFSFAQFYERRARRLFPAALITLLLTSVAATALLSADHLKAFGASLLHATISASNIYFWRQSDYFDTSATLKPLLHTWSLGVEEQFYLVWPGLVVLLSGRAGRAFWWSILGLGCLSFGASLLVMRNDAPAAFFLVPLRAWEFCLGALAVAGQRVRLPAAANEALTATGLGLIVWSVLSFGQDAPFPGVYALAPTIGALFTILGGNPRHAGALLRNPLSLLIGKISYSTYLVHWPLIVFYEYRVIGVLSPRAQVGLVLVSLLGGWVMWRFVEEPYRYPERKPRSLSGAGFGLACASISLALAVGAAHLWTSGGWRHQRRGNRKVVEYIGRQWETQVRVMEVGTCFIQKGGEYDPAHCLKTKHGKPNFLMIGDSYAGATFAGMRQHFGERAEVSLIASAACKPFIHPSTPRDACRKQCAFVFERLELAPYDIIFLHGAFNTPEAVAQLPEAIKALRARGARQVIVLGSPVTYTASVEDTFKALGDVPKSTVYAHISRLVDEATLSTDAVAKTLDMAGGTYVSMIDVLCPDGTAASCRHAQPSSMPIIADKGHINPDGAAWLLTELEARGAPWGSLMTGKPDREAGPRSASP